MSRTGLLLVVVLGAVVVAAMLVSGCGGGRRLPQLVLTSAPPGGIAGYRGSTALWVVSVNMTPPDASRVALTAQSTDGVPCEVVPAQLDRSGTVEVIARPGATAPRRPGNVIVRAQTEEAPIAGQAQLALPLNVLNYRDQLGTEARQRFALFTDYLAAQHPEFGIDSTTTWDGWVPAPNILVVMWYSFLSADYEALIRWHVMIPPYDWTEVFVRERGSAECVWAGKIPTAGALVEEVTPPDPFPRFEAPIIDLGQP
ncbi:MAG: hypothetical protein FJX75_19315 [Armatimonadetes bacterium]|nr:hypothetical protein [Armatimonadota bacterium]